MADEQQSSPAPESSGASKKGARAKSQSADKAAKVEPRDASFSASAWPYVIAAVAAAAVMAYYFFVFVPQKLDYFTGLKFRTLAVASGHIASKIENLAKALRAFPDTPVGTPCEDAVDYQLTAAERTHRDRYEHYVRLVLPELWIDSHERPTQAGVHFARCPIHATVAWRDLTADAAAASRQNFDDLIIANALGDVLWQREDSTPRIGNLSELLGAPDDGAAGWTMSWRERQTVLAQPDTKHLRTTATLKGVNLGGASSLLLVQSVTIAADGVEIPGAAVARADRGRLYVAGLASRARLQQQAGRIPGAWLVLFLLPVMLLFLAIPLLKLLTLTEKERYGFTDLVLLMLAAIVAVGLGAIVPFAPAPTRNADRTLEALGEKLESKLADETREVLALADIVLTSTPTIESGLKPCTLLDQSGERVPRCDLWLPLSNAMKGVLGEERDSSLELDVIAWVDELGQQREKWTTKREVTARTPHRAFDHFRAMTSEKLWTLRSAAQASADGGPSPGADRPFTIDPLLSPTTAELGVIFAIPEGAANMPPNVSETTPFLALNVRPQSIVDPVMPPGYGFAIIAPSGRVLFHSEEGLSLEENFFDEVGSPDDVRQKAASRRVVRWSGDYHGRPHQLRIAPIQEFVGCPWLVVTFQEMAPALAAEITQQSHLLRLGTLNLILLALCAAFVVASTRLRRRRTRDLTQTILIAAPVNDRRVKALVLLLALEALAVFATFLPPAYRLLDLLYLVFVTTPAATFLIAVFSRRLRPAQDGAPERRSAVRSALARAVDALTDPDRSPRFDYTRWARAELALLLLLIGALPAFGFARVVQTSYDIRSAEQWLEEVSRRVSSRQMRVERRVSRSNYSDAARTLLRTGFARPEKGLDVSLDYLKAVGALKVDVAHPGGQAFVGGSLVRWVLDVNPFSTWETRSPSLVHESNGLSGLRLSIPVVGDSRLTLDVGGAYRHVALLAVGTGVLIVAGTIGGMYWARRRLRWSVSGTSPNLSRLVREARGRSAAVLVIGPPRTRKDEAVARAVSEETGYQPVHRIRLLDVEMTDESIARTLQQVNDAIITRKAATRRPGPYWIHVSNLEVQLADETTRTRVLRLMERALEGPANETRAIIATTSVDPIAHFQELFSRERKGLQDDHAPEVSLSRSALLLSRFRRCYLPIARADETLDCWWQYDPVNWRAALLAETGAYAPLDAVRVELETIWSASQPVAMHTLLREIRARAEAHYELLWTSCTRSEKLVLVQLAQEGFVTSNCREIVGPLVAKGIIVERPVLTIFNRTFRDFLCGIEPSEVVQEWERMEGTGLWLVSGRLIGGALVAGGAFYLLTQGFSVQSLLPVVSGTGVFGVPVVRSMFAKITGRSPETNA